MTNIFGKRIFVILMILGACFSAFGQRVRIMPYRRQPIFINPNLNRPLYMPNQQQAGLLRIKENFVNRSLGLTPEQSARFVPLYHQYQQELFGLQKQRRANNSDPRISGTEQIQRNMAIDRQILDLKQSYINEFLKIMPPEKVGLIAKSEMQFTDEVIKQPYERAARPPGY